MSPQMIEFERRLAVLFVEKGSRPCAEGMGLLRIFAEARPADFAFLQAQDIEDLRTPAFVGIPEWEEFASHYAVCELCRV